MSVQSSFTCPSCQSEDAVSVEVWGSGLVPAEYDGSKWIPVDSPGPYVDWEYGSAFCEDCGKSV